MIKEQRRSGEGKVGWGEERGDGQVEGLGGLGQRWDSGACWEAGLWTCSERSAGARGFGWSHVPRAQSLSTRAAPRARYGSWSCRSWKGAQPPRGSVCRRLLSTFCRFCSSAQMSGSKEENMMRRRCGSGLALWAKRIWVNGSTGQHTRQALQPAVWPRASTAGQRLRVPTRATPCSRAVLRVT